MTSKHKRLPVISDYCTGCGKCVEVCPNACLELVWDFAKLHRADDCVSDGACARACPSEVIQMQFVAMDGDTDVGQWGEIDPMPAPTSLFAWFGGLFQKQKRPVATP